MLKSYAPSTLFTSGINVKQQNFPTHKRFRHTRNEIGKLCSEYCKARCLFSVNNLLRFKLSLKIVSCENGKVFGLFDWILFICFSVRLMNFHGKGKLQVVFHFISGIADFPSNFYLPLSTCEIWLQIVARFYGLIKYSPLNLGKAESKQVFHLGDTRWKMFQMKEEILMVST